MSRIRDEILDARVDQALGRWLAWLPRWDPADGAGSGACALCPHYGDRAGLAGLPHDVVHPLAEALDAVLETHRERAIAEGDESDADRRDLVAYIRVTARVADSAKIVARATHAFVEPKITALANDLLGEVSVA